MERKAVSGTLLILLVMSILLAAFEIREAPANPTVRVYVQPTYTKVVPVGQIFNVSVNIESPPEWRDTVNGIVAWGFDVAVDPNVLEPVTVRTGESGYFLYDFANEHGYSTLSIFHVNKTAGLFEGIVEAIGGWSTLGVGAGGNGKLCTLLFKSKSQTAETSIHIYDAKYTTAAGVTFPFDVVDDGYYVFWKRDPVAVITGPVEGWVNKSQTFSGEGSYEPTGTPIVNYLWNFGDGNVTSTADPVIIHTYTLNGTYTVTLVVTDSAGWVSAPAGHIINILPVSSDIISPTIGIVSGTPATPNYDEQVLVTATVTDNLEVDQALLSYTQDLLWYNISMNKFGTVFNATIPVQPYGTLVPYKVYANDTNGNWAGSELYSYTVGDFTAPAIDLSQVPTYPLSSQKVKIYADVTEPVDASGVEIVFLSYRVNNGAWWNSTMTLNEILGLYENTIPQQAPGDVVEYFVKAIDNAGNTNITQTYSYLVGLAGDADHDGDVDYDDFIILAGAYGGELGIYPPIYNIQADFDLDNDVDYDDFVLLAGNYGKHI